MEGVRTAVNPAISADGSGADGSERSIPSKSWTSNRILEQKRHDQQCLYRMGAGATMFEVKDPDPHAVDGGRVLGVRIEVCVGGRIKPYRMRDFSKPALIRHEPEKEDFYLLTICFSIDL